MLQFSTLTTFLSAEIMKGKENKVITETADRMRDQTNA